MRGMAAHEAGLFVARNAELEVLRDRLAQARAGSFQFVVLTGERGIGKTALLRRFVADAEDVYPLVVSGDDSETGVPYAMLEQLASLGKPSVGYELPALSRPSPAMDPAAAGLALRELLHSLQRSRPVVLVVEDAHLADTPSLRALLYAFRRLRTARLVGILSLPDAHDSSLPDGFARLLEEQFGATVHLHRLGAGEFRQLLGGWSAEPLPRRVIDGLWAHTGGNPRHARALIDELGPAELNRTGVRPWPAPRPLAQSVGDRVASCPLSAQRLLAALTVLGERCPLATVRQLAGIGQPIEALRAAMAAGLVEYKDREVAFAGPMVRAAVYGALEIPERTTLHARAAMLVDHEGERLRHGVAAALEPDGDLAASLAGYAAQQEAQGDWTGAGTWFEEAARVAPAGKQRDGAVLDALDCLLQQGDMAAAKLLCEEFGRAVDEAHLQYLHGRLARVDGRTEDAEALLLATQYHGEQEPVLAVKSALELAGVYLHLLRPDQAVAWSERALTAARGTPLLHRPLPCLALALVGSGQVDLARQAVEAMPEPPGADGPALLRYLMARAVALLSAGRLAAARADATRAMGIAIGQGPGRDQINALSVVALIEYRIGEWNDASAHAETAASIAEEIELASSQTLAHAIATLPAASRGERAKADHHAGRSAATARCPLDLALAKLAEASVAGARAQHQRVIDAVEELRGLGAPGAVDALAHLWPWHDLHVDALIALGRLDAAAEELARIEHLPTPSPPAATPTLCRLRGSLEMACGHLSDAETAFHAGLLDAPRMDDPLGRGLLHAAYGTFLRRCGRRSDAAAALKAAHEIFSGVDARPYMERCVRELASTGLSARPRRNGRSNQLTPREASVARLVTEGKRNREVANELVVSENTVEYHLKNIYAKLGVASRSQLILRLDHGHASHVNRRW